MKYMDYLYDEGYLDPELTPASLASAQGYLTYAEAAYMAGQVSGKAEASGRIHQKQPGPGISGRGLVAAVRFHSEGD